MAAGGVPAFTYQPGPVGRWLDWTFPTRGLRNREAALRSFLFDRAVVSRGFQRTMQQFAAAYDILGGDRKRRGLLRGLAGTGDAHLTEQALSDLRETARDASRNDPIVRGMMETYAEGIVGTELKIESRTTDEGWNRAREGLWKERMVDRPCDITGRFNFVHAIFLAVLSYARDGDFFVVFREDGPWMVEGQQCGSPLGVAVRGSLEDAYIRISGAA